MNQLRWLMVLLVFSGALLADPVLPPSPGLERFRFSHLGVEQGLSQATARALEQDRHGQVWIGTQEGLNRVDAESIHVYRHEPGNPQSLPDNHVVSLALDSAGRLWIATATGPLVWLDVDSGQFGRLDQLGADLGADQPATVVRAFSDGSVWAALARGALLHIDADQRVRVLDESLQQAIQTPIRDLIWDGEQLRVAAANGGWEHPQPLSEDADSNSGWRSLLAVDSSAVLQDQQGRLWLGLTRDGLAMRDPDGHWTRFEHREGDPTSVADNAVRGLLQDSSGRLWVGTLGGVSVAGLDDDPTPVFTALRHRQDDPRSLPANRAHALMEDAEGLIWVGTWTAGAAFHDPRSESILNLLPYGQVAVPVVAVIEDGDEIWAAMLEQAGLVRYAWSQGVLEHYRQDADARSTALGTGFVQQLLRDTRGQLWAATFGSGLRRLDEHSETFVAYLHDPADPSSIASDTLHTIHEDAQGRLWIGTTDAGVSMLCAGCEQFEHLAGEGFVPGDPTTLFVNVIYGDSRGAIWFGLRSGGLWRLDPDSGELRGFRANAEMPGSLSHDSVTSLLEHQGELWIGTQGGGLNILSLDQPDAPFRHFGSAEGLAADAIGAVLADQQGRLWVSSTRGLSVIENHALVSNLGAAQGAQGGGYFIGAAHRGASGRLYFGGLNGLTIVEASWTGNGLPAPEVLISDLRLLNTPLSVSTPVRGVQLEQAAVASHSLSLPYDRHQIGIEFAASSFAGGDQIRYRYRLAGLDTDWVLTGAGRAFANYSSLAPGSYLFEVQAARQGGDWGVPRRLEISIAGSPWMQPQAIAAYLLALLVLIALAAFRVHTVRSERARAAFEVQKGRERLQLALWGSGDELWDVDPIKGTLHRENHLDQFGDSAGNDTELSAFWEHVHRDDLPEINAAFRDHVHGLRPDFRAAFRARDRSGGWRWLLSRGQVSQRAADGRALRVSGTTRDITELKQTEQALRELNEQLEQRVEARTAELSAANEKLRDTLKTLHDTQHHLVESEKLAALGGLVAGIAHEINTPLGIAVTAASHLESETRRLDTEREQGRLSRSHVEAFLQAALQGSQLVLRNLNRADQLVRSFKQVAVDQASEQRRILDMKSYLEEIHISLRPLLRKSEHSLEIVCETGVSLDSYPGALYQIVVNLVVNALTHAFRDGQSGHMRLSCEAAGDRVRLCFQDDGRGVDSDTLKRLFEPFFTTRMGQGGSGLGLHIVYNLTTRVLGGRVVCDSEPGRGLLFVFDLPRRAPERGDMVV